MAPVQIIIEPLAVVAFGLLSLSSTKMKLVISTDMFSYHGLCGLALGTPYADIIFPLNFLTYSVVSTLGAIGNGIVLEIVYSILSIHFTSSFAQLLTVIL